MSRSNQQVAFNLFIITVLALAGLTASACSSPPAPAQSIIEQNRANSAALHENSSRLAAAAKSLALASAGASIRTNRERTATDLIRLCALLQTEPAQDTELSDPNAPAHQAITREAEALTARLALIPLDHRAALVSALAPEHPAIIDLVLQTPGFTPHRILQDAVALSKLNTSIDSERVPQLRSALLTRRDTLLDHYLPVRQSLSDAADALSAIDRSIAELELQHRIAGIHASALASWTTTAPTSDPLGLATDQDLRASILDLLRTSGNSRTADTLQERLARLDDALAPRP